MAASSPAPTASAVTGNGTAAAHANPDTGATRVVGRARRTRAQRFGQSAYGALLLGRLLLMGLAVMLLLVAGVRSSWETAQHAMVAEGRERGTMSVTGCDDAACVGSFEPDDPAAGSHRDAVVLRQPIGRDAGETLDVAVRPGTDEVVRTGLPGILYGWLPLTGALLLSAIVIAGGLRMYRLAGATAAVAIAALVVTFAAW